MNKTIGVIAHVDAGKTTFSEALLYHTDTIREIGRVDHQSSYLDSHQLEKERGITIFSDQGIMNYQGDTYYLIDTPGHVDFSPELERTIMVLDYAIVIISAVEGVQGHTETVWQLLQRHKIPIFFFINKTDRVGADLKNVLEDINNHLTEDLCFIPDNLKGELNRETIEFLAERDERLLELYLEGKYRKEEWVARMLELIKENMLYICGSGSALQDQGVKDFFHTLHLLTRTDYNDRLYQDFQGRVYKLGHDENGNRISFLKILAGNIKVRDELSYESGGEEIKEKITQIRIYNGKKYLPVDSAGPGQIVGVLGLSKTWTGQGFGNLIKTSGFEMIPTLKSRVIYDNSLNVKEVLAIFKILNEEDPTLKVSWEEALGEIQIQVMGVIQLEILKKIVKDRFNIFVDFGEPGIIYKETINGKVVGYGHFEPLKHYAEVHLKIEAGARGSGLVFGSSCSQDILDKAYQNLVKLHIFERELAGLLTDSPLTDLKITLLNGGAHNKHTSGGDFREATYRALRQGLEKAEKVLLEPYYRFTIKVETENLGRILADIQKASGTFEPPETIGVKVVIKGRAPVATFMNYPRELLSFTAGKGVINLVFSAYDPCHNQEEVIERINYDKDRDSEYSSSSIFCAKGKGYTVPWYEAEEKMHCS